MTRKLHVTGAYCAVIVSAFALTPNAFSQAVGQPTPTTTDKPVPKQTIPVENTSVVADDSELVVLSPFEISAKQDEDSYLAKETLAGARVRTKLTDQGSAISVVTTKQLQDIAATDSQSLLQYTSNTEVGGLFGNFAGIGNSGQLSEQNRLLKPNNDTRVRGLTSADNTRNYFTTDIPWDGFNIFRVDMQRGPNSILFGVGSPAGIINTSLNDAGFKNGGKVESRYGKYNSFRNVLDYNQVLLKNELALRISAVDDREYFQQKPAFDHSQRIYGALRYDPKFLRSDSANTSIRINFEQGKVNANRARELPPIDAITPWFYTGNDAGGHPNLNKRTFDMSQIWRTNKTSNPTLPGGEAQNNGTTYIPWFNEAFFAREFGAEVAYAFNGNSSTPLSVIQPIAATPGGISTTGGILGSIAGLPFKRAVGITGYNSYSRAAGLPGSQYNIYKDKSLTDPSIFDFYNNLIDGNNKWEKQDWHSFNADISQTFFNNRVGLDAAFYHERYSDGQESFLNDQQYILSLDINEFMPDGSANPNLGRPYVGNSGLYGNGGSVTERNAARLTATGEFKATDIMEKSIFSDILGRHVLTALVSNDTYKRNSYSWDRYAAGLDWVAATGASPSISDDTRQVNWVSYLGSSLLNASSAANAHISPVTSTQAPGSTANVYYFNSTWNHSLNPTDPTYIDPAAYWKQPIETQAIGYDPNGTALDSTQNGNPANYVGWTSKQFQILSADRGDIAQLYRDGAKTERKIISQGLTWQAYFFDEMLIGTYGWRHDSVGGKSASAPYVNASTKVIDPFGYEPTYSKDPASSKDSHSWNVVLHMPKSWKAKMPLESDISLFYNRGENFDAGAVRVDLLGNHLPMPTGQTKDYGVMISTLNDRLTFKVGAYETKVKDATLEGTGAGIGGNLYYLYLLPAWAASTSAIDWAGLNQKTINGHDVQGMAWAWDYANNDLATGYGTQPRPAAAAASDAAEKAMIDAFAANMPDQKFFDNYAIPINVAAIKAGQWGNGAFASTWNPVSDGVGAIQSASGGTIGGTAPVATVDTLSKGIEFELYAQPLKGWNITINASKTTATRQNLGATLTQVINQQVALWNTAAGDLRLWGAGGNSMRTNFNANIYGPYLNLLAQSGTSAPEIRPWRGNLITSYSFDHGMLKGWSVGAADRWQQGEILGYALNTTTQLIDVSKPWKGASENAIDLWVGYERKLTSKINWHIQLNLKDVGKSARLIPISVEPDGSPASYRIANGMNWQVTNTFSF